MAFKYYHNAFYVTESVEEAFALTLKTDLALSVRDFVEAQGWILKDAAKNLEVSQRQLSFAMTGNIDELKMRYLLTMLYKIHEFNELNASAMVELN